jgi:hypothetical protein
MDRVLMSAAWDRVYPLALVQTLVRAGSDHNPLLSFLGPTLTKRIQVGTGLVPGA